MLIDLQKANASYLIVVNNSTGSDELVADFSYIPDNPPGTVSLDFTHMALPLTQEIREDYFPGSFGYQPVKLLIEVVSALTFWKDQSGHTFRVILPGQSRLGYPLAVERFLSGMGLPALLAEIGIDFVFSEPAVEELGLDDRRSNLVPLTMISAPDPTRQRSAGASTDFFKRSAEIREGVERVFSEALSHDADGANTCATVVSEAIDNMVRYGQGGIIGGLYYPKVGEVEIALFNRRGGFGGSTPTEQLEALVTACERKARGSMGGNGIAELSRLAMACHGTLVFQSGNAALRMCPDGSVAGTTDETGLPKPGASVTILLQLLPARRAEGPKIIDAYERALRESLDTYTAERMGWLP